MKTTRVAIRRIIREEIRRTALLEARAIIAECLGSDLVCEADLNRQKTPRSLGIGQFADAPNIDRSKDDPVELMHAALRLLDNAEKDERVRVSDVIAQLSKLYDALRSSGNTAKSTAWVQGVRQAIDLLRQLSSPDVNPATRKVRMRKAQSALMDLGRNVELD